MNIIFTPTAWEQYTEWQREDKKIVKRINELIKYRQRGIGTGNRKAGTIEIQESLEQADYG